MRFPWLVSSRIKILFLFKMPLIASFKDNKCLTKEKKKKGCPWWYFLHNYWMDWPRFYNSFSLVYFQFYICFSNVQLAVERMRVFFASNSHHMFIPIIASLEGIICECFFPWFGNNCSSTVKISSGLYFQGSQRSENWTSGFS